jgi:tetratricopeptide (TPR) repeat protein
MELVVGTTLEERIAQGPLRWPDVVRIFRQLGEALAAAHRAGVVHGDVKPSNVMIDTEGRVRVLDFGLARELAGPRIDTPDPSSASTRPSGTPGYVAPEQFIRQADPQSDQFAFCVSMFRALYGSAPFDETWTPLTPAQVENLPAQRASRRSGVPRWLAAIVERGLAFDPAHRFPSMRVLADALTVERAHRTRLAILGLVVLAIAMLVVFLPTERCKFDDAPFAGIWDDRRRAELSAAAPDVNARMARLLDDYVERWTHVRDESCVAHANDRISPVLYDLRSSCLRRSRLAIAYALERSREPGFSRWSTLVPAVAELADLDACTDDEVLLEERPTEDSDPDIVDAIGRGIDAAYVHFLLGDSETYLQRLLEVEREQADLTRAPAQTLWLAAHVGSALNQRGRYDESIERLRAAVLASHRHPHSRVTEGTLLMHLSEAIARRPAQAAEAVFLAEQAVAELDATPREGAWLGRAFRALAGARLAAGDPERALEALLAAERHVTAPAVRGFEPLAERLAAASIASLRGLVLERLGRRAEARIAYSTGLELLDGIGLDALVTAQLHNNLGLLLADQGRIAEARVHLVEAAAQEEALDLPDAAALTLMNVANLDLRVGHHASAIDGLTRALERASSPVVQADIRFNRAVALHGAGRPAEAVADYDFVLAVASAHGDTMQVYRARIGRGQSWLAQGEQSSALTDLEAALREEPTHADAYDRADVRVSLARADSAHPERGVALASEALGLAASDGHSELADDARQWLSEHGDHEPAGRVDLR